tara:strand:+ start:128 stop:562 length:435 start_codon:yes stop_codon:yes gene_type:complete
MAAKTIAHTVQLAVGDISLNFSDSITSGDTATSFSVQSQVIADSTTTSTGLVTGEVDTSNCNAMILIRNDEAVQTGSNDYYKNLNVSLDGGSNFHLIVKPQTTVLFSIGSKNGGFGNLSNVRVRSGGNNESVEFRYLLVQTEAS